MAEDTPTPAPQPTATAPTLQLVGQYVRDLSFENPGAPGSILNGTGTPNFNVAINVGVKKQADDLFAVELTLTAKAERAEAVLFNVELVYGGVFRIKGANDQQMAPMLMIECPRLIFPFARQVLAQVTQQGGFPPLMMEPVDFTQIYRQNIQRLAQQNAGASGTDALQNADAPPALKN